MALQETDLLVVQSQSDSKLYKLRISDLDLYIEASSGVQFRGLVDLNKSASEQNPAITLPAVNGDLYIVESDANPIHSDWVMQDGITTAEEHNRIIWVAADSNWVLIPLDGNSGGTVTGITATDPLQSDGDDVNPVLSIDQATTTDPGAVARLATEADVKHTDGTGSSTAVVTADLLKTTNDVIENLDLGANVISGVTPPEDPEEGDLWYNTLDGRLYIYYTDADSTQWVETSPNFNEGVNAADLQTLQDQVDTNEELLVEVVEDVEELKAAGTVTSVSYLNTSNNNAIVVDPTSGAVTLDLDNASKDGWGVVQIATDAEITAGTAGPTAVVDAAQLKAVADSIPSGGGGDGGGTSDIEDGTAIGQMLKWNGYNWKATLEIDCGAQDLGSSGEDYPT